MANTKEAYAQFYVSEYEKKYLPEQWRNKTIQAIKNIGGQYTEIINAINNYNPQETISFSILSKYNGVAKTHLSICLMRKFLYDWYLKMYEKDSVKRYNIDYSYHCSFFVKESEIYYRVLGSYKQNSFESEGSIVKEYSKMPFLVIDDLFSNNQNETIRRIILNIVDERIDWRGLPTVITSNLILSDIANIDSRIASRLMNGKVFEFKNQLEDYRVTQFKAKL